MFCHRLNDKLLHFWKRNNHRSSCTDTSRWWHRRLSSVVQATQNVLITTQLKLKVFATLTCAGEVLCPPLPIPRGGVEGRLPSPWRSAHETAMDVFSPASMPHARRHDRGCHSLASPAPSRSRRNSKSHRLPSCPFMIGTGMFQPARGALTKVANYMIYVHILWEENPKKRLHVF